MATFQTPTTRPVDEVQRFRKRTQGRLTPLLRLKWANCRPKVTRIEVGLLIVVVSTAMMIASISLWWMLAYVVVMVVIFAVPAKRRAASFTSDSGEEYQTVHLIEQGSSLEVDCVGGLDDIRSVNEVGSGLANADPMVPMGSNPDVMTTGATKRRGRVRTRKATSQAATTMTDCQPAAWIKVGPGRFVRAEGGVTSADPAEIEEVALRVHPAVETPAEATRSAQAETESLAEIEPITSPEIFSGEVSSNSVSESYVSGSVGEEHGIAPSAFSSDARYDSSTDVSVQDQPSQGDAREEVNVTASGEPVSQLLTGARVSGHFLCQRERSKKWERRNQRRIVRAIQHADRVSWQRVASRSPKSRLSVGFRNAASGSRRELGRRAFRRVVRFPRAIRARSPPGS